MMYWKLGKRNINNNEKPDDWMQPTDNVELNFQDWYTRALNVEHSSDPIHTEHYYLRLNGLFEHENDYLYDELPFFEPSQSSLFMVDPDQERGINCRFGSKGIIAEAHYDMSRNMILVLNGRKRYILAHPEGTGSRTVIPPCHATECKARETLSLYDVDDEWHNDISVFFSYPSLFACLLFVCLSDHPTLVRVAR
jgi:hypothetical protein